VDNPILALPPDGATRHPLLAGLPERYGDNPVASGRSDATTICLT